MTGRKEFTYPVGGSGDSPVSTSQQGSFETDNYTEGGAFSGSAYPLTVDPPETIQELNITATGGDIVADIVTKSGTTINGVELNGNRISSDHLAIDSVTFKDPQGTGAKTAGWWVGE